jgi:uncharacterized phage protein gp47/JayE
VTAYTVGQRRSNDTPSKVYEVTIAGTSAAAGGPTGTGQAIVDGTVTWKYVGLGLGAVDAAYTADVTGPDSTGLTGNSATIETAVSGWNTAIFSSDATLGRNEETDAEYRLAQEVLLQEAGNATVDALLSDIGSVTSVTNVQVFPNDTDVTDGDGVPPHSFEAVVLGGTDANIAQAILDSKAAGIRAYGSSSASATDDEGNSYTMYFSRPTSVTIHTIVELTKDADYPADGDTQVKTAIATTFAATLTTGDDVIQSSMYQYIFDIAGVTDVTKLWIGTADPPVAGNNIAITSRQLATFDSGDVDVTST